MTPVNFPEVNLVVAKDQPEYLALAAHKHGDDTGRLTFCWELDQEELNTLVVTRRLWHTVMTFGQPLQPQLLQVVRPDMGTGERTQVDEVLDAYRRTMADIRKLQNMCCGDTTKVEDLCNGCRSLRGLLR